MSRQSCHSVEDRSPLLEVLEKHWVMSLSVCASEGPHSAPVFYAVADDGETLVFLSDEKSLHVQTLISNPKASAGIYLETEEIGVIQGVQLSGAVEFPGGKDYTRLEEIYYKRHQAARLFATALLGVRVCAFHVSRAKLINNRFGFGNHMCWEF